MLFYLNKLFCVQVLFLPCYNNFADNNASFTFSLVDSCILTNGSLTSSLHRPKSLAAYFTGAGLLSKNKDLYEYKYRAVNELPIAKAGYYPLYEIESIANKYSGDGTSTLVNVAEQPHIVDYENDFTSNQNSYGYVSNDWGSSSVRVHDTTEGCLSITGSTTGTSYYLSNLPQDQLYTLEVEVEQTEGAEAQVHTYLLNESGSSGGSHAPRTFYYEGAGRRRFTLEVKTIRNGSSIQFMLKNNNGSGDGTVKLHYIKVSHVDTTQPPVNDYYYYPNNVEYQTWLPNWHEESEKWWEIGRAHV